MNAFFVFGAGAVGIIALVTVAFGVKPSWKSALFLLLTLWMSLWALAVALFLWESDTPVALVWATTLHVVALLLAASLVAFLRAHSGRLASARSHLLLQLPAVVLGGVIAFAPGLLIRSVDVNEHVIVFSPGGYEVYSAVFLVYAFLTVRELLRQPLAGASRLHWLPNSVVGLCLTVATITNLFLPYFGHYDLFAVGPVLIVPVILSFLWAIMKGELFDVKFVAVRAAAYLLAFGTLAALYYVAAFAISLALHSSFGVEFSPFGVVLAIGLALLFQPIWRVFDRATNRIFFRHRYDRERFYGEFNQILSASTDIRVLLRRATESIARNLKASQVQIYVTREGGRSVTVSSNAQRAFPDKEAERLDSYVAAHGAPRSLLAGQVDEATRRLMVSHAIVLAVPLYQHDSSVGGYILLGEHQSSNYTARDIRVLETIASELVIAIQNALSVQEVKELNATLQQRIENATSELRLSNSQLKKLDEAKNEFISMASHQLRTPLTSIKGYVDMILEGDAGEITPTQRKFLTEAFVSSERMVRLINDFLNVSRLQTGKFMVEKQPLELAEVVRQEVDGLKTIAAQRDLTLRYHGPKKLPLLELDEGKIRQVIMNFIDNAIYYSAAGSTIHIYLQATDGGVEFTVKDTGIGVPASEQAELFQKFYRASNARKQRPDGTGVGLFLAKKVITEHDGQVIFSSKEGKGSTFGFRVPLL